MLYPEALAEILAKVDVEDFYDLRHQVVYSAMRELHSADEPVEYLRLAQCIGSQLAEIGGLPWLTSIADSIPTGPYMVEYYVSCLKQHRARRDALVGTQELAQIAAESDTAEVLERAEALVTRLRQSAKPSKTTTVSAAEAMQRTIEWIDSYVAGEVSYLSLLPWLDNRIHVNDTDMIVLGARPSIGKTALALNMISHICGDVGGSALIFSMEMDERKLMFRLVSQLAGRSLAEALRTRDPSVYGHRDFGKASDMVGKWPLFIDDTGRLTMAEIAARTHAHVQEHGRPSLIVVDYLQEIKGGDKKGERQAQIEEAAKELKKLANDVHSPILVLSQIGREFEKRSRNKGLDCVPSMSELRDSGGIEQSADVILLIHRPRNEFGEPGPEGRLVIAKARDGELGYVNVQFNGAAQRFREGVG